MEELSGGTMYNDFKPDISFEKYSEYMKKYPLLTEQAERSIVNKLFFGNDTERQISREQLINHNLGLVTKEALRYHYRFSGNYVAKMDLVNAGIVGLIDAVDALDPSYKNRFSTFATYRIHFRIAEYVRLFMQPVNYPNNIVLSLTKYRRIKEQYDINKFTDESIANKLGITKNELLLLKRLDSTRYISLAERNNSSDSSEKIQLIEDKTAIQAYTHIENGETKEVIEKLMSRLNDIEKDIIKSHFLDNDTQTLEEIGSRYGVSKERIRQIENKVLSLFRKRIKKLL